jgi:hypothetical protein
MDYQALWEDLKNSVEANLTAYEATMATEGKYTKGVRHTYWTILHYMQDGEEIECRKTLESSDNSTTSPQS